MRKKEDKMTIEQVLQSRGKTTNTSFNLGNKTPYDYSKKSETPAFVSNQTQRQAKSKERDFHSTSYMGVDSRRYQSSKREELKQFTSTPYMSSKLGSTMPKGKQSRESDKNYEVEAFTDPNSNISNSNILNVVSPNQKIGFHITDLLDMPKTTKGIRTAQNIDMTGTSPDIGGMGQTKPVTADLFANSFRNEDKYMIKNFRLIKFDQNNGRKSERDSKPITAAPLSLSDNRGKIIKKITGHGSRKNRLAATSTSFGPIKSIHKIPVNNSLLYQHDTAYDDHMEPINEYFEKLFEETHYMFPKNKTKFGVNALNKTNYGVRFAKHHSQARASNLSAVDIDINELKSTNLTNFQSNLKVEDDPIKKELRDKASRFSTPKYKEKIMRTEQDIRNRKELDKLLQNSLEKRADQVKERSYELMLNKIICESKDN